MARNTYAVRTGLGDWSVTHKARDFRHALRVAKSSVNKYTIQSVVERNGVDLYAYVYEDGRVWRYRCDLNERG